MGNQQAVERGLTIAERGPAGRRAEVDTGHEARIAQLRRQLAVMSGQPDRPSAERADVSVIPVPVALEPLFPSGGLAAGVVVACDGARSVLLSLIASASAAGSRIAVVGMPRLCLLSAVELGADLSRIATIPYPGADPVEVASVLLDGMDVVVLNLAGASVAPSRTKVLMGRVRKQSSTLIVTGGHWPGARTSIDAEVTGYRNSLSHSISGSGVGRSGMGRIGGMRLRVSAQTRGRSRSSVDVELVADGYGAARRVGLVHTGGHLAEVTGPVLEVAN